MSGKDLLRRISVALRGVGLALLAIGVIFKIQHWPFADALLIAAWAFLCASVLVRLAKGSAHSRNTLGRDLILLGLISAWFLQVLHWPGKGLAWAIMATGVVLAVRAKWRDYIPTRSDVRGNTPHAGERYPIAWLFGGGTVLVVLGTMFRIMHWPYATAMLVVGLVLLAIWFVATRRSDGDGH